MSNGLDFAWHQALDYGAFKRQGFSFVARYLSHDDGKNLHRDEAAAWLAQGINIVLVWETTSTRAEDGYAAGQQDARDAVAQAAACGAPANVPLFFAVDEDTTVGPKITAYAQGFASVIGIARTGVYGSYNVVRGCFDTGLVTYGWQTYAWSGGQWEPRAHLRQVQNGASVLGASSDLDQTTGPDYGQWRAQPIPEGPHMSIYIGPPAHFSGSGNLPPFAQTIHATCPGLGYPSASQAGRAVETAHYFQNPASGGSAHVVCDIAESVRCAPDDMICWHAPPNTRTLGYEICGEASYTREQWLSPQAWPAVIRVAVEIKADAAKYGIPIHRSTVAEVAANHGGQRGHVDVSQAFHQSDHTDPGPGFPWPEFMALLTNTPAAPVPAPHPAPAPTPQPSPAPPPAPSQEVNVAALPTLNTGDSGQRVRNMQGLLEANGQACSIDGQFGSGTANALRSWQGRAGLGADGVCGPHTWSRLIGV